jgi:hypothetical protein
MRHSCARCAARIDCIGIPENPCTCGLINVPAFAHYCSVCLQRSRRLNQPMAAPPPAQPEYYFIDANNVAMPAPIIEEKNRCKCNKCERL